MKAKQKYKKILIKMTKTHKSTKIKIKNRKVKANSKYE